MGSRAVSAGGRAKLLCLGSVKWGGVWCCFSGTPTPVVCSGVAWLVHSESQHYYCHRLNDQEITAARLACNIILLKHSKDGPGVSLFSCGKAMGHGEHSTGGITQNSLAVSKSPESGAHLGPALLIFLDSSPAPPKAAIVWRGIAPQIPQNAREIRAASHC